MGVFYRYSGRGGGWNNAEVHCGTVLLSRTVPDVVPLMIQVDLSAFTVAVKPVGSSGTDSQEARSPSPSLVNSIEVISVFIGNPCVPLMSCRSGLGVEGSGVSPGGPSGSLGSSGPVCGPPPPPPVPLSHVRVRLRLKIRKIKKVNVKSFFRAGGNYIFIMFHHSKFLLHSILQKLHLWNHTKMLSKILQRFLNRGEKISGRFFG